MKISIIRLLPVAAFVAITAISCNRGPKVTRTDTETSGYAVIGADECMAPLMNEELAVFTGLHPEAKIDPVYVGEKELFDLLLSDSVRLIVAARELTAQQLQKLKEMKLTPRSQKLAGDAIALIINNSNPDSLISVETVRKIMTGEITSWSQVNPEGHSQLGKISVVFDNPASSTIQFVQDSIVGDGVLSPDLRALSSNQAVIEHVGSTPDALGIIGVNWISNMADTLQLDFDSRVRVMAVGREPEVTGNNTFKPFPAYINNLQYPFVRNMFIILTDYRQTLPAGFVKFAAGDVGQRIVLKAGLVPATRPNREVQISSEF